MNLGFLIGNIIDKRKIAAVTLLNLGTLSWFFILNSYMDDVFAAMTPNNPNWGFYVGKSIFIGFAIFWSVTISFIGSKISRRKLLFSQ